MNDQSQCAVVSCVQAPLEMPVGLADGYRPAIAKVRYRKSPLSQRSRVRVRVRVRVSLPLTPTV